MEEMKGNRTIKDIARSLNLSGATISNALNNKGRISKTTKEAVIRKAKELGYEQNIIGKALIEGKTDIIGVFVPEISNEYYSQVISGIEEVLNEKRYSIILIKTGYDAKKEFEQVLKLQRLFISGLIFLGGSGDIDIQRVDSRKEVPILFIDRVSNSDETASVLTDNLESMQKAVFYLNSMGHEKIGYFANYPDESFQTIKERFDGFLLAVKKLRIRDDYIFNHKNLSIEPDKIFASVKSMFEKINKEDMPTAFLCQNDIIAIILIHVLYENNVKVPDDISVMGFDNVSISKYMIPSLTTVKQPKRQMGVTGAKLLLKIIDKERITKKNIILSNEIVVRDSVKKYEKKLYKSKS